MNKISEALNWISERMQDRRDLTPQPPVHPVPPYVDEANKAEYEAWQAYMQVTKEELESEKGNPDYERLKRAKNEWIRAADAQLEALRKLNRERYEQ
jgi:hypothetical protein